MAPKEPTRQQLSSKLSYSQNTPLFLQKLKNRIAGIPDEEEEEDLNDEYGNEFEDMGSGRVPIPRRPAIPERPAEDPGSADEDGDDEKPQVVVLREGKHLTQREAENAKRKERGLGPLPEPDIAPEAKDESALPKKDGAGKAKEKGPSLSFSSSKGGSKSSGAKRKILGDGALEDDKDAKKAPKKKAKKNNKTLLSFGDDA